MIPITQEEDVKQIFEGAGLIPRSGQVEVAQAIRGVEGDVLLVAPTGWGKTLAVLAALKTRLPVLWLVRSLEIGRRVSEDASRLGLKAFVAAGRAKTCPYARVGDVDEFCRLHRSRCPYFLELLKKGVGEAWSYEELPPTICRYYAQDVIAADVVVQNYFRRVAHRFETVVVDEAHNLLRPVIHEVRGLEEAIDELAQLEPTLASQVRDILEREGVINIPLELAWDVLELYRERLLKGTLMSPLARLLKAGIRGDIVYREAGRVQIYHTIRIPQARRIYISATIPEEASNFFHAAVIRVPISPRPAQITDYLTSKYGEETIGGYSHLLWTLKKKYTRIVVFTTERLARRLHADFYEERLPPDWRGVALFNIYGRFAEGVDIPADAVVILGAPFLPPEVTEKIGKYYRRIGLDADAAHWLPMVTAVLQAIGRATREPGATPDIILADYRFKRYMRKFEPYLVFD
ncbi:MAG: helicase C-terminal domain-containing protein [Infirmifilum sp.]